LLAVSELNKIFDKWLRGVFSRQSTVTGQIPSRPRLQNGMQAAPRVKDINWQIAIAQNQVIKEKPLPFE
jgi:hypothetical protein